ncbi:MAG: YihY/virulence factor BrkB family protein [Planctomycetota bacterium]|nr:YihY/virulence factor BrkB family protein [Planctomycetota bacterium]
MRRAADGVRRRDRILIFLIESARVAGRQMRRDRAPMMAAALTYRLLFALIPLMVIAAAVMQVVVDRQEVMDATRELVAHLQLDSIQVHDQRDDPDSEMDGKVPFTLGSWIVDTASRATQYDASGLTIIGGLVLIYSAMKLFREIELSFSIVSSRGSRRIWWRRWSMYLIVLLLGPLVLVGGLWLLKWGSDRLTQIGGGHVVLVHSIELVLSWLLIWGLITVGYLFIPAQRMSFRATAFGALVAAIILLAAQWGFRVYVKHAVVGSPAGSLGLVPIFLFWLYLTWLSLLYGLQFSTVSARISRLRQRREN